MRERFARIKVKREGVMRDRGRCRVSTIIMRIVSGSTIVRRSTVRKEDEQEACNVKIHTRYCMYLRSAGNVGMKVEHQSTVRLKIDRSRK